MMDLVVACPSLGEYAIGFLLIAVGFALLYAILASPVWITILVVWLVRRSKKNRLDAMKGNGES